MAPNNEEAVLRIYLETERGEMVRDYEKSCSEEPFDIYAIGWIKENGERFAIEHDRN